MLVMKLGCFSLRRVADRTLRNRGHIVPWILAALFLGMIAFSHPTYCQSGSTSKSQKRLQSAIDKALTDGRDAILPPHVSHLLGISPEAHEVPVKQFAQMGEVIKGFEVSEAAHNDVVIFVENRAEKRTTFYLTSLRGTVRKVLEVKDGTGYDRVPTPADKKDFEKEKQYWLDKLAPLG